ncbi:MAG TPA: DUF5678 domain-containing protein [Blastocatellia bacterium]|nr:DUF5678 domain-containing protein [Blastocatellia bacterium]
MSQVTYEQILSQVRALPPEDVAKLREFLNTQDEADKAVETVRAQAQAASLRDLTPEYEWLEQHRDEYAGQWVALKGGNLISSGPRGREVIEAARKAGHPDALFLLVEARDDRPFVNI